MAEQWQLKITELQGRTFQVTVQNPMEATVASIKELIRMKQTDLPAFLQRLFLNNGRSRSVLEDGRSLSSYSGLGLGDGSTLHLLCLVPFELYVHDLDGRLNKFTIPSASPEKYLIRDLTCLVEEKLGKLSDAQFLLRKTVVEEACHGKSFTIGDYGIKAGDTLVLARIGLVLNINNPQADVCFMVDCTGSMGKWIEAVKSNVKELRDKLCRDYGSCDLRFSFVRYTDYDQPSSTRTTHIPFTRSQPQFHGFVEGIAAQGGGDGPEDIMGGLRVAFNQLNWRNEAAKVLIHIADCPCHGKQYHNLNDTYPDGDPAGTSHEKMMSQVVKHNIQYSFGYIEKSLTDQMIAIFNASLKDLSKQRLMIRQFDATKPSEVGDAAYRAVSASILAEEVSKRAPIRSYTVVKSTPNWSVLPTREGKKTPPVGPASLSDLQQGISIQPPSVPFQFKCAANPFEDGEEGLVFQAYDAKSNRNIVLKQFKYEGDQQNALDAYLKVLEVHTIASTYAREFSAEKQKPSNVPEIEFVHTDVVESSEAVPQNRYYICQPYIEGNFEKFNNNQGLVLESPMSHYLQAFSHYSWIKSGKSLLICDLQGVSLQGKVILSDPAIHHKGRGGKYGATDRGLVGIEAFFKTHRCNNVCKSLHL